MSSDEIYALLKQDSEKGGTDSINEFDVVMPSDVGTEQQGQRNEQIAVNAATNASMMQDTIGKNEDHIVKRFTKLKTPVVSWRRLLTETIMHRGDSFLSYNRISRRTTDSVIFPVRRGTVINLVVGIDSSGSMTANDINTAISEIYGIIGSFDNFKLTIVSCDVGLRVLGTFENEIIPSIAPIGGGGTNMQPILDFAYELGLTEVVDSVIIMSDGHINNDDIDVATYGGDVIFMVTRNFDLVVPSATMVYMNEEKL
jgi:predicted metal-dependent peptidase